MKITPLALDGVRLVEIERLADERGYFARLWCRQAFADAGLAFTVEQTSASYNDRAGTVRGLHFAWPPAAEGKLVRCARGRMLDVLLDLRPQSPSYRQHLAVELDADSHRALLLPPTWTQLDSLAGRTVADVLAVERHIVTVEPQLTMLEGGNWEIEFFDADRYNEARQQALRRIGEG